MHAWGLFVGNDSHGALPLQVKNVTGRKLVGLRWWNEANDSGTAWRFESAPEVSGDPLPHAPNACLIALSRLLQGRTFSPAEKRLFWIALVANVVAWGGLIFLELVRLKFGER